MHRPDFLAQLVEHRILVPSGVDGIYGRSRALEDVIAGFERLVVAMGESETSEEIHFPPGMSRVQLEHSGYLKSFPHLAGTVHSFCGGEHDHVRMLTRLAAGEDWTQGQKAGEVVLTPAACYPLYPIIARRGPLAPGGVTVGLSSYCFRHEPSADPGRMQMFRMREFVRIGEAEAVQAFRRRWIDRSQTVLDALMLEGRIDVANDPFFGRSGRIVADSQRAQALKLELLVPVASEEAPTACMSFNYHQDHFARTWDITLAGGTQAHSACVGFGLERIALALFRRHGFEPAAWPPKVRRSLWG